MSDDSVEVRLMELQGRLETHERVCEQIRLQEQEYRNTQASILKEVKRSVDNLFSISSQLDKAFDGKLSKLNDKMFYALGSALGSSLILSCWLFGHAMKWY